MRSFCLNYFMPKYPPGPSVLLLLLCFHSFMYIIFHYIYMYIVSHLCFICYGQLYVSWRILAIVNNVAMNVGGKYLLIYVFLFLVTFAFRFCFVQINTQEVGPDALNGSSIFKVLGNLHTSPLHYSSLHLTHL